MKFLIDSNLFPDFLRNFPDFFFLRGEDEAISMKTEKMWKHEKDKISSKFCRKMTKFIDFLLEWNELQFILAKISDDFLLNFWSLSGAKECRIFWFSLFLLLGGQTCSSKRTMNEIPIRKRHFRDFEGSLFQPGILEFRRKLPEMGVGRTSRERQSFVSLVCSRLSLG